MSCSAFENAVTSQVNANGDGDVDLGALVMLPLLKLMRQGGTAVGGIKEEGIKIADRLVESDKGALKLRADRRLLTALSWR